ncbi:MAG: 3'-5' exonuclease [Epsilonproteobacteria bacterium]|nr:MAG: 3'-5' exonuclease [Campylobacterota bacterium]
MLIYLDLETTGLEKNDRLCSVGCIAVDGDTTQTFSELIKPPKKIRPEASAIHHISNEMVKEASLFKKSDIAQWLQEHNNVDNILICHNIDFDLKMLEKEGFVWQGGMIDTLKCTKHLIQEIDRFALQYLRYELRLYKTEDEAAEKMGITLQAHTALSDAFHVMALHHYLSDIADDDVLQELTQECALVTKFNFGKYSGRYIEEIARHDSGYLEWMLENMFDMDSDLRYSVKYYLKEVR